MRFCGTLARGFAGALVALESFMVYCNRESCCCQFQQAAHTTNGRLTHTIVMSPDETPSESSFQVFAAHGHHHSMVLQQAVRGLAEQWRIISMKLTRKPACNKGLCMSHACQGPHIISCSASWVPIPSFLPALFLHQNPVAFTGTVHPIIAIHLQVEAAASTRSPLLEEAPPSHWAPLGPRRPLHLAHLPAKQPPPHSVHQHLLWA